MRTIVNGVALALAVAGPAPAGPYAMQPRVLTITPAQPIAQVEFSSLYAQARIFDVRVQRWSQRNGQDVLTPDDGFMIVPAVFSVEPYQTVIVRIEPRAFTAPQIEESYKVVVTSVVPGAQEAPPSARRLEAALFEPPAVAAIDPSFTLKVTAPGRADLVVANTGNTHIYLGKMSIENAHRKIYDGTIGGYVLANSTRTFPLRLSNDVTGKNADVTYDDEQGSSQTAVVTVVR